MDALKQLQDLLRELFHLDFADLDFGLYRLLHIKRNEIEAFLTDQLPNRCKEAFQGLAIEENTNIARECSELAKRIRNEIADDAILENGDLNPDNRKTKVKAAQALIKAYEVNREKQRAVQVSEAHQVEVFNHLYAFFSRYYESGDFIPCRRYRARETYAVPYNGEEVFFHWANKDQHYVKTAQNFRDYAFSVETVGGSYRVRFLLTEANLPQGNTKGDTRYFFPVPEQAIFNQDLKEYRLPFHYRLPTEQEVISHGKNSRFQESVLQNSLPKLMESVPDSLLQAALGDVIEQRAEQQITLLLKRLRHFYRKNTTDYFIHKHLKGFLIQELEFYLKDQVLHFADLDADVEGRIRTIRVIRKLGEEIILFLSQIEEVEKRLFEKRKFVLRTDYLVPIKEVPEELWGEVIKNKSQLQAWKELFAIDPEVNLFNQKGKVNKHFLQEHPTLVLDTSFFDKDFKDRLLSSFDDLDEATDGLLIHSENYQALRLLEHKYANQVKCIYIDPPYSTGSDDFIYKDRYRHSSWLAMMNERLNEVKYLLSDDGVIFISIDDNEVANLKDLMDGLYGSSNFVASIIWQKVYSPKSTAKYLSEDHDYLLAYAKQKEVWRTMLLPRTEEADARYGNIDNDARGPWKPSDLSARNYYSKGQYEVTTPSGKKFRNPKGTYWRVSVERFSELDRDNRIWWGPNGDNMPALKRFLSEVKQGIVPKTLWPYSEVGHTQEAKQELLSTVKFTRTEDVLNTVKPTRLVKAKDKSDQRTLIIWRDMKDLDPAVERHFLESKIRSEGPFNEILINGDTATPGIQSLDGIFKRLVEGAEK